VKRFRQFLGKKLDIQRATNEPELSRWNIKVRYAPEVPEDFDEYEFGIDYKNEQDVGFLVAIERGKIARLLFGWTVPENPDMLRPMSDNELEGLLDAKGRDLIEFFHFVT